MTHWQFRKLNPNDTSGTSTAEDNFAQEERTSVDILVRECIQNPLDARQGDAPVRVNFHWRDLVAAESGLISDLLTEGFRKQRALSKSETKGETQSEEIPAVVKVLVIEDFGTIGLRGRYDDSAADGDEENWNAFWFREGEGAKPSKANGGAGQGKLTMYVASEIRTVVALTTRASDGKRLLFGSCRFRRNYKVGNDRYAREARWGNTSDPGKLAMPIEDGTILNRYEQELRIERGDAPGTSFLIPIPDSAITPEAITKAVIDEYYLPILRGRLSVFVDGREISRTTISELANQILDGPRLEPAFRGFLDEIACQHLDLGGQTPDATLDEGWQKESKLSPDNLRGSNIEALREKFQTGSIISAEFPIWVSSVSNGRMKGSLKVFIQEAGTSEMQELFIRQDLAVDKEKSLRSAKRLAPARALILVDDENLSRFLAAAEEPTHREWNGSRPKLALQYKNAAPTLRLVRHAANRLLELLVPPATKDTLALAAFFPDMAAQKEAQKVKKQKMKDAPDGTDDGALEIPPPKPRKLDLIPLDDGATVHINPSFADHCLFPIRCTLELAYATEFGKPFEQWDAADFYLDKSSIGISFAGVEEILPSGNKIVFEITVPEGYLSVSGFDKNRQLEARLKYSEADDANNIQDI